MSMQSLGDLRILSSANRYTGYPKRGRYVSLRRSRLYLPAVVGEGAIAFCHFMDFLALLDRRALIIGGVQQFSGEFLRHGFPGARVGRGEEPAHGQRLAPVRRDFHRNLIGRAAHPARLDLDQRRDVLERLIEDFDRVFLRAVGDDVERPIHDVSRHAFLALAHHPVNKLLDDGAVIAGVRRDSSFGRPITTWHSELRYKIITAATGQRAVASSALTRCRKLFLRLFRPLAAVLGTALPTGFDARRIERAAHNVITHARQVLHAAAAHQDHRVLLEGVPFAWNIGRDLEAVRQAHAGDLAQRRVGFLRSLRADHGADPAFLRRAFRLLGAALLIRVKRVLQSRSFALRLLGLASFADELIDRRHVIAPNSVLTQQAFGSKGGHRIVLRWPHLAYFPIPLVKAFSGIALTAWGCSRAVSLPYILSDCQGIARLFTHRTG